MSDDRRHIRDVVHLDHRSGWAVQRYAIDGSQVDLAEALEINRGIRRGLLAEAKRIGRGDLATTYEVTL